jgi:undecaprenyl pyrophosphate phosphatase UppP
MYENPTLRQEKRRKRRALFAIWIAVSMVVAAVLTVGGPVLDSLGYSSWLLAPLVPALMIFMIVTGFFWLAIELQKPEEPRR